MAYAVRFSQSNQTLRVKLSEQEAMKAAFSANGDHMKAAFDAAQYVRTGKNGIDGTTFYPSVEGEDCTLHWTNDGGKPNPSPVNLRGKQGIPGSDANVVPLTNLELEKLLV